MDENQKKKIIDTFDDKEFWRRYYSPANRRWFIRKIIDHLITSGRPDHVIENETKEIIEKSKIIVSERIKNQGSPATDLKRFWEDRTTGVSLRQIVYNLIALHPQLLLPANKAFFDFLIDRRIRMVKRMQFFVNPNLERLVFLYPGTTTLLGGTPEPIARLNDKVKDLWTGLFDFNGTKTKPFVLNSAGKADPVNAVTKIFEKGTLGTANFFYCDDVIGILLMDSLIASADPSKLIKALVAEGDEHFKIDHPYQHYGTWPICAVLLATVTQTVNPGTDIQIQLGNSSAFFDDAPLAGNHNVHQDTFFDIDTSKRYLIAEGNVSEILTPQKVNFQSRKLLVKQVNNTYTPGAKIYIAQKFPPPNQNKPFPVFHFMNDSRVDKTCFEQSNIDLDDAQVADVVKVKNHILYRRYYTNSAAGEENAILMESSRSSLRSTDFDNGFKLAGHGMSAKDGSGMPIKQMANELIDHVNNVIGILTAIAPVHLKNFQTNGITSNSTVNVVTKGNFHFFEYDLDISTNLTSTFLGNTNRNKWSFKGFVIKQPILDEKRFEIINIGTKDSTKVIDQTTGLPIPTLPPTKIFSLDDIFFQGNDADFSTTKHQLSNWGLFYLNTHKMKAQKFPLFERDNKTPKRFSFQDLKADRTFFFCFDNTRTLMVTRPKVDFNPTYQTFLRNSGAIP
jgi:hypothetical protein